MDRRFGPNRFKTGDDVNRVTLALLALAAIPLVHFALDVSKGLDFLMFNYLVDDAFYYFELSRHIPEFNRGIPTSGFHPLYAFLVAPLHRHLDAVTAIGSSQFLLILSTAVSVVMVYAIVSRHWDRRIGLLAASGWAVSPLVYQVAMTGAETTLAAALVLGFFLQLTVVMRASSPEPDPRSLALLGLLGGAAFLARMDTPLIIFPAAIYLLVDLFRRRRMKSIVALSVPALVPILTWIILIRIWTGDFYPTSGSALRVIRGISGEVVVPVAAAFSSAVYLARYLMDYVIVIPMVWEMILFALTTAALVASARVLTRARSTDVGDGDRPDRQTVWFSLLVVAGLGIWASFYIFWQGGFRIWYFGLPAIGVFLVALPLLMAGFIEAPFRSSWPSAAQKRSRGWATFAVLLLASLVSRGFPTDPQEYDKYRSALAADRILREQGFDGTVAAFNTGIHNYFMSFDVLNLDGVVNPDALQALKDDRLEDYLKEEKVSVLIEHDFHEIGWIRPERGVEVVRWIDLSDYYPPYQASHFRPVHLWKLVGTAASEDGNR